MRYVIIGNSAAGIFAAEAIREADQQGQIIIISNETYPAYARCLTSYYLTGKMTEENTYLRPADYYRQKRFELILDMEVSRVDAQRKIAVLADGKELGYDKLLIATGARPTLPDLPGADLLGVFGLRTLKDAKAVLNHLGAKKEVVIIGGGFVALKAAYALKLAEKNVTVVISSKQVLSQMLDEEAAKIISDHLAKLGIKIILQNDVVKINGSANLQGYEEVSSVQLTNGNILPANLVIIGKGVTPNLEVVENSGIQTAHGILVNQYLQTNLEDVYAAGDVAQAYDLLLGKNKINAIWPNATEQGRIAGFNMAGKKAAYQGSIGMNSVDFAGLSCITAGLTKADTEDGCQVYRVSRGRTYQKLVFKNGRLVGYILIGNIFKAGILTQLIKEKIDVTGKTHLLMKSAMVSKLLW